MTIRVSEFWTINKRASALEIYRLFDDELDFWVPRQFNVLYTGSSKRPVDRRPVVTFSVCLHMRFARIDLKGICSKCRVGRHTLHHREI